MLKKTLEIVIPAPFPPFPSDRGRNNGKAEHPQNWAVLQVSLGLPRMPLWLEATGTAGSTPGQPQNSATASGREGSILQSSAVMSVAPWPAQQHPVELARLGNQQV